MIKFIRHNYSKRNKEQHCRSSFQVLSMVLLYLKNIPHIMYVSHCWTSYVSKYFYCHIRLEWPRCDAEHNLLAIVKYLVLPYVCTELRSDCCETGRTAVLLSASPTAHTGHGMSAVMPTYSETPQPPTLQHQQQWWWWWWYCQCCNDDDITATTRAFRECKPLPMPKLQPKVIQESNLELQINPDPDACRICPKMLWMHYLVGASHFTKYGTNRPLTVWKMLTNVKRRLIHNGGENDKVSVIHTRIRITTNHF